MTIEKNILKERRGGKAVVSKKRRESGPTAEAQEEKP